MATAKSILGMPSFSVEDKGQQILATWEVSMFWEMGDGLWLVELANVYRSNK